MKMQKKRIWHWIMRWKSNTHTTSTLPFHTRNVGGVRRSAVAHLNRLVSHFSILLTAHERIEYFSQRNPTFVYHLSLQKCQNFTLKCVVLMTMTLFTKIRCHIRSKSTNDLFLLEFFENSHQIFFSPIS